MAVRMIHPETTILRSMRLVNQHDHVSTVCHLWFDIVELVHQRENNPAIIVGEELTQLGLVASDSDILRIRTIQLTRHLRLKLLAVDDNESRLLKNG